MKYLFFISDIQDIWLFSYLMERLESYKICYEKTGKITSPHNFIDKDSESNFRFCGIEDEKFIKEFEECDYFITKEFLPFTEEFEGSEKIIGISWVGETIAKTHDLTPNAPPNPKKIIRGCNRFYIDKNLKEFYDDVNFKSIPTNPKYYFLNDFSREELCESIGLDPNGKYFTIFMNPNCFQGEESERNTRIMEHALFTGKNLGYECIVKNKLKHGLWSKETVPHDYFCDGSPLSSKYHVGIILQAISEFSIGFATCASIESEIIGSRFISVWDSKHKIESRDKIFQSIKEVGNAYRWAKSDNVFNICTSDRVEDIFKSLVEFIKESKHRDFSNKIPIDPFLESLE